MENHKVLFQKNYKKWALVDAKYNISQFPDGEYTFEIIQDKKVVFSQTIHNTENEALLNAETRAVRLVLGSFVTRKKEIDGITERIINDKIQEIITGKSKRSSDKSGKSNKTNGNDANNEASTTVQSQDPFGSGGSGGKNGAGNGPFSGPGNSDDGDGGLGKGNGESRVRTSNADLPQYDIDYESNIHLQLTVNANGEVVAAKSINSLATSISNVSN